MLVRIATTILLAATLCSCATVSTRTRSNGADGIGYSLPKGQLRLKVTDTAGTIAVTLGGPVMSADPAFALVARIPRGNLSDNNVTVTVDDKTNLLKKVEVTSVGRVTDIATNFAKNFALQGADSTDTVTVFEKSADVTDLQLLGQQANAALDDYFSRACAYRTVDGLPFSAELQKAGLKDDDANKAVSDRLLYCRKLALTGAGSARSQSLIQVSLSERLKPVVATAATSAPISATSCMRGICYRPLSPVDVSLTVRGAFSRSDTFLMPDPATVLFVDLVGGAFATQKYTLDFTDGVLTTYKQDGQSELVGLVSLPLAIVKAVLAVPAEVLGLKEGNLKAETAYLEAVTKNAEKQDTVATLCKSSPNRCPKTAYKIIGGPLKPNATPAASSGGDNDGNAGGADADAGGTTDGDDVPTTGTKP